MEHISKYLDKYKALVEPIKLVCEIKSEMGIHQATVVSNDKTFIGQGFTNTEALDNAFAAINNSILSKSI